MKSLVKAGIRIVLIIVSVNVLLSFVTTIAAVTSNAYAYGLVDITLNLVPYVVGAVVFAVLWWKTDAVVSLWIGEENNSEVVINVSDPDILHLVLRVLGIILLINSITDLLGLVAYHVSNYALYSGVEFPSDIRAIEIREAVVGIVTLLFGLWLVFGWDKIIKALSKIRNNKD